VSIDQPIHPQRSAGVHDPERPSVFSGLVQLRTEPLDGTAPPGLPRPPLGGARFVSRRASGRIFRRLHRRRSPSTPYPARLSPIATFPRNERI